MRRPICVALAALSIAGCASYGQAGNTAGSSYAVAHQMAAGNDCSEALPLYRLTLQRDPHFISAYLGIADCARQARNYEAAREAYTQALAIDGEDYQLYYNRGIVEAAQGDYGSARNDEMIALRKAPRMVSAYVPIAQALGDQNDFGDAIDILTRTLAFEKSSELLLMRGEYHRFAQEYQAAQKDDATAAAIAVSPKRKAAALAALAKAQEQLLQFDTAALTMQRALSLDPENPDYYAALGAVLMTLGRYKEAESLYLAAVSRASLRKVKAQMLGALGAVYAAEGSLKIAESTYMRSIAAAIDPNVAAQSGLALSALYEREHKTDAAIGTLVNVLKVSKDPATRSQANILLGDAYAKIGRKQLALQAYRASKTGMLDPAAKQSVDDRIAALRLTSSDK